MSGPCSTQHKLSLRRDCQCFDDEGDAQLLFDDERVFRRLRIYDASLGKLVNECADAMRSNPTIISRVRLLQRLTQDAERREAWELEEEEEALLGGETGIRTEAEEEMYEPLVSPRWLT